MSANAEVDATVMSIELTVEQIEVLRVYITDRRIHYLAQSASKTMHIGVSKYWNKHYNLQSGQTSQLALFQGGGDLTLQLGERRYKGRKVIEPSPNSHNFRSRKGNKRLVSFTFGKPNSTPNFQSSEIYIHSFPMNLYERDVMLGGWASGTLRKGTHIMKRLLPPTAESELEKTRMPMLADINQRWNEMGATSG